MKKVISLILVLAMVCALLIVPTYAHGEDEIAPCVAVAQCPECKYPTDTIIVSTYKRAYRTTECQHHVGDHIHTGVYKDTEMLICNNCGFRDVFDLGIFLYTLCQYGANGML